MGKSNNNYAKFLFLWAGELISSVGGGLTSFGLGLYIFQKTGSAADMAFLTLLGFLPALVLKIPAGVLADKYDRRLLMMIGDGLSGLGVLNPPIRQQSRTSLPRNSIPRPTASYPWQEVPDTSSHPL